METRQIMIADTKTQRRYTIETAATTLGELQDQMTAQGIDYSGMTFTEGISKTQLITRDSPLPTNVMYKGRPTNNLVMLLTNTQKNIASGTMSRKEVYSTIKALHLEEEIKQAFGDNYTRISTADLVKFIDDGAGVVECLEDTEEECHCLKKVATSPNAPLVEWLYASIKMLVADNLLYASDVETLAELLEELAAREKESSPFSEEEIDNMIASI